MKIFLTNDDGIDAPGLAALEAALPPDCSHVIAAPRDPCSGFSHQVTTDRPLQLMPVEDDRYHVDGTPVDCVRLAMMWISVLADALPSAPFRSDFQPHLTVAFCRLPPKQIMTTISVDDAH